MQNFNKWTDEQWTIAKSIKVEIRLEDLMTLGGALGMFLHNEYIPTPAYQEILQALFDKVYMQVQEECDKI